MLHKLIIETTPYFYISKLTNTHIRVYLFEPFLAYNDVPAGHCFINPNYIAANKLFHKTTKIINHISEKCNNLQVSRFKGFLKQAFLEVGIGKQLRNGLIAIHPHGSRVSLSAIDIYGECADIDIDSSQIINSNYHNHSCSNCLKCTKACPVGALESIETCKEKCLRHQMEHYKTSLAPFERLNGSLVGCEVCFSSCPLSSANCQLKTENHEQTKAVSENMPEELLNILKFDIIINYGKNGDVYVEEILKKYIGKNYLLPHRLAFFAQIAKNRENSTHK